MPKYRHLFGNAKIVASSAGEARFDQPMYETFSEPLVP